AGLLAGIGPEAFDEVDVSVADDVFGDPGGAQVELGEIFQQGLQAAVAVLGLAEVGLAVEVNVAEDALELGLVRVLDVIEHNVDQLADVGLVAALVQRVEVAQEAIEYFAG